MTDFEEYQQTGMLGAYRPEQIGGMATDDGRVIPHYQEVSAEVSCDTIGLIRELYIGGRLFRVHSMFDLSSKKTPTEAMLRVIDSDLEKESYSG